MTRSKQQIFPTGSFSLLKKFSKDKINSGDVRSVKLNKGPSGLGFHIVGGEDGEGIFISFIIAGGSADLNGELKRGDQILSVNGIDLKTAVHGEAVAALKGPEKSVKIIVEFRPEDYTRLDKKINEIKKELSEQKMFQQNLTGMYQQNLRTGISVQNLTMKFSQQNLLTNMSQPNLSINMTTLMRTTQKKSIYVRALFDYNPNNDNDLPGRGIAFEYGDILHATNASDHEWWQAKKVTLEDDEEELGLIPSHKRWQRKQRARDRSIKFQANTQIFQYKKFTSTEKKNSFSRKFPFIRCKHEKCDDINEQEQDTVLTYEPVQQITIEYTRPVIILGLFKDRIIDDLISEFCHQFGTCIPHTTRSRREDEIEGRDYYFVSSREQMQKDIDNQLFIEAGQHKNNLYGTSISSVREVCEKGKHCLLNVSGSAIKRLQAAELYPIAIFVKPKSVESIIEMNKRMTKIKAQETYECILNIEREFGKYFTAVVQGDTPEDIDTKVKSVINKHSISNIWVPSCNEELPY